MEVEVNGGRQEVKFLPDAEAKIDAIPLATYATQLSRMQLQKAITPKTATGVLTHMEGEFAQRRVGTINIHVLRNLAQPALSGDTQILLGMLHEGYPHTVLNNVQRANEPLPNAVPSAEQDQPAVAPLTASRSNTLEDTVADARVRKTFANV